MSSDGGVTGSMIKGAGRVLSVGNAIGWKHDAASCSLHFILDHNKYMAVLFLQYMTCLCEPIRILSVRIGHTHYLYMEHVERALEVI